MTTDVCDKDVPAKTLVLDAAMSTRENRRAKVRDGVHEVACLADAGNEAQLVGLQRHVPRPQTSNAPQTARSCSGPSLAAHVFDTTVGRVATSARAWRQTTWMTG